MSAGETTATTAQVHGVSVPVGLYIDGAWQDSPTSFDVVDPSDGSVIARVPDAGADHARAALDAADHAQRDWADWAPYDRAELFHRAHRLLVERAEDFAVVMTAESGKPLTESRAEFALSAGFFLWYAEQINHLHGTYANGSRGGYRIVMSHQPVGPCLLITPWNFLHTTTSAAISDAVMDDARLRKISFTGSTGVGSHLLRKAAAHIVNASMELGGDGPFVVLDDADVDLAVEQAVLCKFRNAGQACVAANRIILHADIAEEFTAKFVAKAAELRVGNGFEDGIDVGPIISRRQRDRVERLVTSFRELGAEILLGGGTLDRPGFYFEPTVMRLDACDSELCTEELFAPLAALYTVKSVPEALEFANDTDYGLAAYLFTRDLSRAVAIAERLDFGMVGVNRGIMADPAASFGGTKMSGLGREGGHHGIYEFLEPKYLAITIDENAAVTA
jgi:succinate-semialdehyde dehydrogenase/glutarate-semialdehyde dehydrogenase